MFPEDLYTSVRWLMIFFFFLSDEAGKPSNMVELAIYKPKFPGA